MQITAFRKASWLLQISSVLLTLLLGGAASSQVSVLTQHNDNQRTGANLSETILNTSNVNVNQFGKLFNLPVDGYVFAQPLYVPNVSIAGGVHNVLYIATEHDSLYAFDADSGVRLLNQMSLGVPVPSSVINTPNILVEVGITSTPVIDIASKTIYVLAKTYASNIQNDYLHAIDMTTLQDKVAPVKIVAQVNGKGYGANNTLDNDGTHVFWNAHKQNQRPALTLVNGVVYIGFGSHEDYDPYHGWVLACNATTLAQLAAFNTTPNGGEGGIWMGGQGFVVDASNNIYLMTGNSTTSLENNAGDLGESFVKLTLSGASLTATDYFKPNNYDSLNAADADLGSGGLIGIPGTTYVVGGGKQGLMYLVDTANMGKLNATKDQVIQEWGADNGLWGSPVFWNSSAPKLYVWGQNDRLKSYSYSGGLFTTSPNSQSSALTPAGDGCGALSVSSNGSVAGTGIVWATAPDTDPDHATVTGKFYAFDATNLANKLWDSSLNSARDSIGNHAKFCPPTVANGKVYVATDSGQVCVFGLLAPAAPTGLIAAPADKQITLTWQPVGGATSYNVKRSLSSGGPFTTIKTGQTTTTYIDTGLTNGTLYYYVASALNGTLESANSIQASATPTANANTAIFVKLDSTHQGTWKTVYGSDGYSIQGDATAIPSYAQLSVSGANAYTWVASTTDVRALQKVNASDRIAACWYSSQNFIFDVNLTDGQAHQISLYALDWDYNNRNTQFEALDATTNAVLNSQTLSSYDSGKYLVWNIRGHIKIRVTNLGSSNGVVNGIFFDTTGAPTVPAAPAGLTAAVGNQQVLLGWQASPGANSYNVKRATTHNGPYATIKTGQTTLSYADSGLTNGTAYFYVVSAVNAVGESANSTEVSATPLTNSNTAAFVKLDTMTQGSWKTVYGSDGYLIQGDSTTLPTYAQVSLIGPNAYTWVVTTTDIRALVKSNATDRIAACWYADQSFIVDVTITDGTSHQIALYCLDWDFNNRNMKLEVLDGVSNAVLNALTLTNFSPGNYLVWNIGGHVKFRITNISSTNAVLSGIFFK